LTWDVGERATEEASGSGETVGDRLAISAVGTSWPTSDRKLARPGHCPPLHAARSLRDLPAQQLEEHNRPTRPSGLRSSSV